MKSLRSVAVLGAGTMGSRIAAHFANAGVPALLLDIATPNQPNRNLAAQRGLENAARLKPAGFFTDAGVSLVSTGNFDDDMERVREADWILEAVTEDLAIKRALWKRVDELRRPGSIVSTNTSGIPLGQIAEGMSEDFRAHFLGTHFFNPPRYLHLAEVIPGPATGAAILAQVSEFCDRRLGKGVVPCKDTPNFIGNRIGSFFGATIFKIMQEDGYTIEEVDALTGPLIGLPNSATFRLLDLVGIDIWAHVSRNLHELAPGDPWRERFRVPAFMSAMLERGWLGDKSGQGFYKKTGRERALHALDWKTLEYHPAERPKIPTAESARLIEDLPARLRLLLHGEDRAGAFLWKLFSDVFLYAAERIPEIADRVVEVDRAMRWGYAHKLGPFELWDAVGFQETARRIESEGRALPATAASMLEKGAIGFYRPADERGRPVMEYFDLTRSHYCQLEDRPGVLELAAIKRARGVVKSNSGASLIDIGDGVLCVEFHSKANTLGEDSGAIIEEALEQAGRNFQAIVIGNQGEHFSAGANLMLILLVAGEGDWDELNRAVHRFQQTNLALKYAPVPVVAAPFGRALGGGAEVALHAARIQASAELYMGLVEVGAGLIPAGGGCKEMLLRTGNPLAAFELIGYAKVSGSAADARKLRLLARGDGITMNPERLIADAKAQALALINSYQPGSPRTDISVGGEAVFATMKLGAWMARQGGYISDYDLVIAEKLAHVLSGGRLTGTQTVTEQYLLDLEREAFLSLCGNPQTLERMQHLLKTGKPLRN
ncbi:MAG: 3-hydroxyacyl-CoA dehydrogenase/enoyl-CoA hydratase family protein [Bryobacterales bacterium]|nr:3-hydroxyacyl-CoA dehydrogenase/enoyl-CoA hydratase family protein [Bryobacterales bacterium]